MKKILILFLILFVASDVLIAQNDSTTVETNIPWISGGFLHISTEYSKVGDFASFNPVIGGVVIIKDHFDLGFYATLYNGNGYTQPIIFPNNFDMTYRYGGGLIGYRVSLSNHIDFKIRTRIGHGEVLWERLDTGQNLVADKILVVEPQFSVGYVYSRAIRMEAYFGYRQMSDLDIPELTNEDFNGIQFGFGVNIGHLKFNR